MSIRPGRWKLHLYLSIGILAALPVLAALPQHAAPQTTEDQIVASVDPAQSKIQWTLGSSLHAVHGTFNIKSGSVQIDPSTGKASGEIIAYSTSGESGNDGRDKKMHKDVLESARFPDIVFRPDSVAGKLAAQGDSSVQMHGVFVLHGSEHGLTVPVQANLAGDHWSGSAKFGVPFIDWGLKNPSTWLLKVDHTVQVELELKGTLKNSAAH